MGMNPVVHFEIPAKDRTRMAKFPAGVFGWQTQQERRLAASVVADHTGELRPTFYPRGLRLLFEAGRLTGIEDWREDHAWGPRAQASVPSLVFLKLLLGHRSPAELREAFPDVVADDDARPVLEALFPRRSTWLLPLD